MEVKFKPSIINIIFIKTKIILKTPSTKFIIKTIIKRRNKELRLIS